MAADAATGAILHAMVGGGKQMPDSGAPVPPVFMGSPKPMDRHGETSSAADTDSPQAGRSNNSGQSWLPEADWCEELLSSLAGLPASERVGECKKKRDEIRERIAQLDVVLHECEEQVKLKPSKTDKHTAGTYHACFRHLHWGLDRCRQLQEATASLEDYDTDRLDPALSLEYAFLSVDVVQRHDHASRLLGHLCGPPAPLPAHLQDREEQQPSKFSDWLMMVVAACGSRVCAPAHADSATGETSAADCSSECPAPEPSARPPAVTA